jgi:hypothetical protein
MLKRDGPFLSLDEALTVGWSLHCPQAALWWHSGVVPEERTGLHQELFWLEEPGDDDDLFPGDDDLEPPLPFAENDAARDMPHIPVVLRAASWPPLFVWVGAALALLRERNLSQGILDTEGGPLLVRRTAAADARMRMHEESKNEKGSFGTFSAPSARRCRRCPWDEWCPALLKEGWNDANGS